MFRRLSFLSFFFFFFFSTAHAEHDSAYYPSRYYGAENKMYWKEPVNVMQDLSQFSKLYVTYHGCAWSPYETGSANPCNVEQAEDSTYWYLGQTPCYRANAAYSLYGILDGDKDRGCTAKTFINSFVTTQGVESLTASLQQAGVQFSMQAANNNNNNNNNNDENNNENNNDDAQQEQQDNEAYNYPGGVRSYCYHDEDNQDQEQDEDHDENYQRHNGLAYGSSTSYGLGCEARKFVQKTFQGAYCTKPIAIHNQLATFNGDLSQAKCIAVYEKNEWSDNQNGNAQQQVITGSTDFLLSSRSCDVTDTAAYCPDPHGKLAHYSAVAQRRRAKSNRPIRTFIKRAASWLLLATGIVLAIVSAGLCYDRSRNDADDEEQIIRNEKEAAQRKLFSSNNKNNRRQRSSKATQSAAGRIKESMQNITSSSADGKAQVATATTAAATKTGKSPRFFRRIRTALGGRK